MECLGPSKTTLFFGIEDKVEKNSNNKHVDFRKTENFVRSKCYPKDKSKDKGEKANFRKSCKNFKIVDGHLTYKGKRKVVFDNDRKRIIIHGIHEGLGFSRVILLLLSTCHHIKAKN